MSYLIYQMRLPIVIGEPEMVSNDTENYKFSQSNNIVDFSPTRLVKCLPIAHQNAHPDIPIANIYITPRDSTYTHNKTVDTDIQHRIQHITNIPHSVFTRDVNAHSTLWHSYTDEHRGQLIADVISNSDHITLNTNQSVKHHNTTNIFTRYHHGV